MSHNLSFVKPDHFVGISPDIVHIVADQKDGSLAHELVQLLVAFLAKLDIPNTHYLINQHYISVNVDGYGEAQARSHARGIGLDGHIYEFADICELDNLIARLQREGGRDLAWQAHLSVAAQMLKRGSNAPARKHLMQAERILEVLAAGLPSAHRLSFWQDVRRVEVRRLLATTVPSSGLSRIAAASMGHGGEDLIEQGCDAHADDADILLINPLRSAELVGK